MGDVTFAAVLVRDAAIFEQEDETVGEADAEDEDKLEKGADEVVGDRHSAE